MNCSDETCFSFRRIAFLRGLLSCTSGWGSAASGQFGEEHLSLLGYGRADRDSWLLTPAIVGELSSLHRFRGKLWTGRVQRSKILLFPWCKTSLSILGEPAETLAVALPLEHTTHEYCHVLAVELVQGDLLIKPKYLTELLFTNFISPVNVTIQDRHIG